MKEEVIFFIAAQTTRNQTINDVNRILLPLLLPDKPTPMLGSPPFDKFAGNFQRLYLSKSEIERSVVETGTDKEKSYFFVFILVSEVYRSSEIVFSSALWTICVS